LYLGLLALIVIFAVIIVVPRLYGLLKINLISSKPDPEEFAEAYVLFSFQYTLI
jgi:hypothetical protein